MFYCVFARHFEPTFLLLLRVSIGDYYAALIDLLVRTLTGFVLHRVCLTKFNCPSNLSLNLSSLFSIASFYHNSHSMEGFVYFFHRKFVRNTTSRYHVMSTYHMLFTCLLQFTFNIIQTPITFIIFFLLKTCLNS